MKLTNVILFSFIFLLFSCSSYQQKPIVQDALSDPVKSYDQKKIMLKKILSGHNEFDQTKKAKIESIVDSSLRRSEELRNKESQIISKILKQSIVEQGSFGDIKNLKNALNEIYKSKYQNFNQMVTNLKTEIGIKPKNQDLMQEFDRAGFFRY